MNRFLERVIRERELDHVKTILETEPKSLAPSRGRPPMGQRSGVKVDDELRRRILERARKPGFQTRIAEEFGVSKAFVSTLLKGHRRSA